MLIKNKIIKVRKLNAPNYILASPYEEFVPKLTPLNLCHTRALWVLCFSQHLEICPSNSLC